MPTSRKQLVVSIFLGLLLLTGCGFKASSSSGDSNGSLTAESWTASSSPVDSGTVFDTNPQIVVPPNGGDGAIAVWLKQVDLDPFDTLPAVYHLFARRFSGGAPSTSETPCPFGNPDPTGSDGICLIDTGSRNYNASAPKISMDDNGNAIVVWEQNDGNAQRVYARRFSGATWDALQRLNNSTDFSSFNASAPAIALRPNGINGDAMAIWSQYYSLGWQLSFNGAQESILALAEYNGKLYAGQGTGAGDGDVLVYNGNTSTWSTSFNGTAESIQALYWYNGLLYAGQGSAAGNGDILVCNPAASDNEGGAANSSFSDEITCLNNGAGNDWSLSFNGAQQSFNTFAEFNGLLYAGQGTALGNGDIYVCDPAASDNEGGAANASLADEVTCLNNGAGNDWSLAYNGSVGQIQSLVFFNGRLYAGLGTQVTGSGEGDIIVCNPDAADNEGGAANSSFSDEITCLNNGAGNDWSTSFNGSEEAILSLGVFNDRLYAGQGIDAGNGDILVCNPGGDGQCDPGDWSTSFNGALEGILAFQDYNGALYAGQGTITGNGDVLRCVPGADGRCDPGDWTTSFNGALESIFALEVLNGGLYAGQGTATGNGDVLQFSAGWQTMARRFTAGAWALNDTGCPANSGANDGICFINAGTYLQPSSNPKVAMDDSGQAIAAFVQMVQQSDCMASLTVDPLTAGPGVNNLTLTTIACSDSTLQANLFNGSWQGSINLDPGLNSVSGGASQLICFEVFDGGAVGRGTVGSTDACVHINDFDLAMNRIGRAALLIKTEWDEAEDWSKLGATADVGNNGCAANANVARGHVGRCAPNGIADQQYLGESLVARVYDGAGWAADGSDWPLLAAGGSILANFGRANTIPLNNGGTNSGSNFSIKMWDSTSSSFVATGCPSTSSIDGVRVIFNCRFDAPKIALEPDGTTAIALYEQYNGTSYDIIAQRYDGTAWALIPTTAPIDAGAEEAHAPQITMENTGNGVAAWTQKNGGKYRIYSNCFANSTALPNTCNAAATGWQGAGTIDGFGTTSFESAYYNPVLAMTNLGGTGSAISLFLGWSVLDNTTRLYYATGP